MNEDVAQAIAEDAETLAALHDRELTPGILKALRDANFPDGLALRPATDAARKSWAAMRATMAALPTSPTRTDLDVLASEYAAVYLTSAYGGSPCESAWVGDEGLNCQASMFQWRALHAAAGLAATDWRHRPDDHIVLQLLYLARMAPRAQSSAVCDTLTRILDEHLLTWLPLFVNRVERRRRVSFYADLSSLTLAWARILRDMLATTGESI